MNSYSRIQLSIILTLAIYFGWLLSFPFYGPVLYALAPDLEYRGFSMPFIFTFFHIITYLFAGLLVKDTKKWRLLMFIGLIITIGTVTAQPLLPVTLFPWVIAMLGISSSLYVIGWSYPFTSYVPMGERLKLMASIIILANAIFAVFKVLSESIAPASLIVLSSALPWLALLPLFLFPSGIEKKSITPVPSNKKVNFPVPLMLVFCVFVFGLYLCGGFMYSIMHPYLWEANPMLMFYRFLPYMAVVFLMFIFGQLLQRYFLVYMGTSLLGLAFVSYAIGHQNAAMLFLTTTLIEAAFAFLDLFTWVTLADLAQIYGVPFKIFGLALASKLLSILSGELVGDELTRIGEAYRLFTALFAAASIFLAYTVIPWFNERMKKDLYQFLSNTNELVNQFTENQYSYKGEVSEETPLERAVKLLPENQKLTPRELEIVALLLKGSTNKELAAQLHISINTLKSHLHNIYFKYGVSQKREFFSKLLDKGSNKSS